MTPQQKTTWFGLAIGIVWSLALIAYWRAK